MKKLLKQLIISIYSYKMGYRLLVDISRANTKIERFLHETNELMQMNSSSQFDDIPTFAKKIEKKRRDIDRKYWTAERIETAQSELIRSKLRAFHMDVLLCSPGIDNYPVIVDFGSGTGFQSLRLRQINAEAKIFAYDTVYNNSSAMREMVEQEFVSANVEVTGDIQDVLDVSSGLIFANAVFSWLPYPYLRKLLNHFREKNVDVLMMSNSLISQSRVGRRWAPRDIGDLRYDHNYIRVFDETGYELSFIYAFKDLKRPDKNVIVAYARVPK